MKPKINQKVNQKTGTASETNGFDIAICEKSELTITFDFDKNS